MGWDIEKFVDGPDLDEFGCAICLDALRDPQTLGCPSEHLFCKECLDGYSRPNVCPLCVTKVQPDQRRDSPFVKRLLGKLQVRCMADTTGVCAYIGPLGDGHHDVCEYRQYSCRNPSCHWQGDKSQQEEHKSACMRAYLIGLDAERTNAALEQARIPAGGRVRGLDEPVLGVLVVEGNPAIPFHVSERVYDTFVQYLGPAETRSNLGVPWIDFLHAMNAISFTGHKTVGSSWKFIPTGSIVNNAPISVHEPHPDATQRPNQVSWTGKRLKKAYGLDMNMFSVV